MQTDKGAAWSELRWGGEGTIEVAMDRTFRNCNLVSIRNNLASELKLVMIATLSIG